ncbi:hypothetical protein PWT90_03322 [Aphanocladium album]|nr:hypothetical protein PWT90_03322 [Aphanocladium album]
MELPRASDVDARVADDSGPCQSLYTLLITGCIVTKVDDLTGAAPSAGSWPSPLRRARPRGVIGAGFIALALYGRMPLHMREATEADTDAIARLARAAFDPATDAIARNLFPVRLQAAAPSSAEDPAIAWRRTRKGIKMKTERILLMVVTDDALDGKVVGFSMWEEPLREGHEGESMTKGVVPCPTLDEEAYKQLRTVSEDATIAFLGKDGSKHMWYLDYLGVDPEHQRRGIGKMLLNWGLDKAREENRDTYLIATPAGLPLYQAVGFEDLGAFMLFDTPHNGMIKRRVAQ